jgi:hypothetical protein
MKKIIAFLTAFFCSFAHAQWSDELTGLWWNPAEPGWGLSIHQQGDVMFASLLVYDRDGAPEWYYATLRGSLPINYPPYLYGYDDTWRFEGDLLRATRLGSAPAQSQRVGTISFVVEGEEGSVGYTVNGRGFGSPVKRAEWAPRDLRGTFTGAKSVRTTGPCDVHGSHLPVSMELSQAGDAVRIELADGYGKCEVQGSYLAQGVAGSITGTAQCTGKSGLTTAKFSAWNVRVDRQKASFGYWLGGETCSESGSVTAARLVANTTHDDATGLFWDWREPGWGIAVHQQAGVLFAVVLTHRADGSPTWLVAPSVPYVEGQDGDLVTYRGDLSITSGTAYDRAGGYRGSDFRARRVGQFEMQYDTAGYHYVAYDNEGQGLQRTVSRLVWRPAPEPSGTFAGVRTDAFASMAPGSPPATAHPGRWTLSAQGGALRMRLTEQNITCEISGHYVAEGLTAQVNASTASCTDEKGGVTTGTFFAYEVRLTPEGLSMGYVLDAGGRLSWGAMAGVRID